ncbi:4194_t:CDS:2, partial [Cetraspora pellucida]
DKLTSDDKQSLEIEANKFLMMPQKIEMLIDKVNSFFKPENQLTLMDINVLNVAANQFLALRHKKTWKLLKMAINKFFASSKDERERVLKNEIRNFMKTPLSVENKLSLEGKQFIESKLIADITTLEKVLEKASILGKALKEEIFEKNAKELLNLTAKENLETAVNKLITLKRKSVLLILGSGGTGKSTFNRYLARLLWEKYKQDMTQPVPLFIALAPLERFINKNQDFIEAYLQEKGKLSTDQINELRKRKFVFILDGYDEIAERDRHCYDSNMFSNWINAKIIISCRPEYLNKGYEEIFWPKKTGKRGFQELTLTPFSRTEIEQYINNYVHHFKESNSSLWDADKYIQKINDIPQIKDLVCNPILLKITLNVLPGILIDKESTQINHKVLYDEFIKKWFERAYDRLKIIQLKPEEREEFNHLNNDFTEHCLEFAFKMFIDNNKVVVDYNLENKEITSDWATLLGDLNVKYRLMRFSMPLIRRGNQHSFFHKSLRDYLIACALLDSLNDTSEATLFNKKSIIPEPAIQNFIIFSKNNANIQIASTNAITVLTRAKIQLSINLDNIRIQGADLSDGVFKNLQFVRADLNGVNFRNANLQSANFKDATLQDANLQNANLQYANLQNENIKNIYFRNANLQYAKLDTNGTVLFSNINLKYISNKLLSNDPKCNL